MWEVLEKILSVIGILSLFNVAVRIISILRNKGEWVANVAIEEYPITEDTEALFSGYPTYYPEAPWNCCGEFCTHNLFIPQGCIIKKLVLYKCAPEGNFDKYKKVKALKNITPSTPVCFVIERKEAIPEYMIKWRIDYGATASYCFFENLRNGNNSVHGIEYRYSIFSRIRQIIGLK